jgi:hypothetical protein
MVALAVFGVVHPLEIDATVAAEVIAQLAGFGVQRQQARIDGRDQNPLRTLLQVGLAFSAPSASYRFAHHSSRRRGR